MRAPRKGVRWYEREALLAWLRTVAPWRAVMLRRVAVPHARLLEAVEGIDASHVGASDFSTVVGLYAPGSGEAVAILMSRGPAVGAKCPVAWASAAPVVEVKEAKPKRKRVRGSKKAMITGPSEA